MIAATSAENAVIMHGIAIGREAEAEPHVGGGHTPALGPVPATVPGAELGTAHAQGTGAAQETDPDPVHARGIAAARGRGQGPDQCQEIGIVIGSARFPEMTRVLSGTAAVPVPHSRMEAQKLKTGRTNNLG